MSSHRNKRHIASVIREPTHRDQWFPVGWPRRYKGRSLGCLQRLSAGRAESREPRAPSWKQTAGFISRQQPRAGSGLRAPSGRPRLRPSLRGRAEADNNKLAQRLAVRLTRKRLFPFLLLSFSLKLQLAPGTGPPNRLSWRLASRRDNKHAFAQFVSCATRPTAEIDANQISAAYK